MDHNFEQKTERTVARISATAKASILKFMSKYGMTKESQYVQLAIRNQIKSDEQAEPVKTAQP